MRRYFCVLLFFASSAWAQFTTVTGTVIDPNGVAYANGTITAQFITSATPKFTSTNQPYTPPTQPVGLNASGVFVMQLADNTTITPGGTTWNFSVCSGAGTVQPAVGNGPICFTVTGQTISGSSQDLSLILSAAAPALTINPPGGSLPKAPGANYTIYSAPLTFLPAWAPHCSSNPALGTFEYFDPTGSDPNNPNAPNPGPACGSANNAYLQTAPSPGAPNAVSPTTTATPVLTANYQSNPSVNPFSISIAGVPKFFLVPFNNSFQVWADSYATTNTNSVNQVAAITPPVGSAVAGSALWGVNSATKKWFTLSDTGVESDYDAGGTVTYTGNQTAAMVDNGKLVIMNCTGCAYSLPATQPSAQWFVRVMATNATPATITLNGGDTYNSQATAPTLNPWRPLLIHANSATSTDYEGDVPLTSSGGVTLTPGQASFQIAATSTGISSAFMGGGGISAQTPTASNPYFIPLGGAINTLGTTEASIQQKMPVAGTLKGLAARVSAAEGAAATLAFTVMKCTPSSGACAGSAQAVTCTIGNSALECSDTAHSFTWVAGDYLDIKVVQTGTGTSQFWNWVVQYTQP